AITIFSLTVCPFICQSAGVRGLGDRRDATVSEGCCCCEGHAEDAAPPSNDRCDGNDGDCICHGATVAAKPDSSAPADDGAAGLAVPSGSSAKVLSSPGEFQPVHQTARPPTAGHRLRIVLESLVI
ncbi:MAG: hypothetical protein KJZ87_17565, partial [Thermoguttaceae bacterium]|nr:hypothetical protein [Thermoguttaceae bacterium]